MPNSEDLICRGRQGQTSGIPSTLMNSMTGGGGNTITVTLPTVGESAAPASAGEVEEEENAFVQSPDETGGAGKSTLMTRIRPISEVGSGSGNGRHISTSDINQFVDPAQFPDGVSGGAGMGHGTTPEGISHALNPLFMTPTRLTLPPGGPGTQEEATEGADGGTSPFMTSPEEPSSPTSTQEAPSSTTTGDGLDPNRIYPLPVPFLPNKPKKIHTAHHMGGGSGEMDPESPVVITQTLPPSIIIARPTHAPSNRNKSETGREKPERFEEFELQENAVNDRSRQPPQPAVTDPSSAAGQSKGFPYDFASGHNDLNRGGGGDAHLHQHQSAQARTLPTAIIVICMSTVALVMSAVFVGMCVAKRRQIQLLSSGGGGRSGASSSSNPSSVVGVRCSGADARIQLPPPIPHHQYYQQQGQEMGIYGTLNGGGTMPRWVVGREGKGVSGDSPLGISLSI